MAVITSASIALPLTSRAQQPMPVIGYLAYGTPETDNFRVPAFRQGLKETGYIEGENVAIEYRGRAANMRNCRIWRRIWFGVT